MQRFRRGATSAEPCLGNPELRAGEGTLTEVVEPSRGGAGGPAGVPHSVVLGVIGWWALAAAPLWAMFRGNGVRSVLFTDHGQRRRVWDTRSLGSRRIAECQEYGCDPLALRVPTVPPVPDVVRERLPRAPGLIPRPAPATARLRRRSRTAPRFARCEPCRPIAVKGIDGLRTALERPSRRDGQNRFEAHLDFCDLPHRASCGIEAGRPNRVALDELVRVIDEAIGHDGVTAIRWRGTVLGWPDAGGGPYAAHHAREATSRHRRPRRRGVRRGRGPRSSAATPRRAGPGRCGSR